MPVPDIEQAIADRLKFFRESLKIKQKEVAEGSGSSQSHISAMEVGAKQIQPRVISFLAEKYNLNVDWLFTGRGKMVFEEGLLPKADKESPEHKSLENHEKRIKDLEEQLRLLNSKTRKAD